MPKRKKKKKSNGNGKVAPNPTTPSPTTPSPATPNPTTPSPATPNPTTPSPATPSPATPNPTTPNPTTPNPTTPNPTTPNPTTPNPTTPNPTTPTTPTTAATTYSTQKKFVIALLLLLVSSISFCVIVKLNDAGSGPGESLVFPKQRVITEPSSDTKSIEVTKNVAPKTMEPVNRSFPINTPNGDVPVEIKITSTHYYIGLGTGENLVRLQLDRSKKRVFAKKGLKGNANDLDGTASGSYLYANSTFSDEPGKKLIRFLVEHFTKLHIEIVTANDPEQTNLLPQNTMNIMYMLYSQPSKAWSQQDWSQFK